MSVRRDLDYDSLGRGPGLRERLRALGGDPRLVIGGTIGVLMVVVSAVVLVALVATGNATDGGGIAVLVMVLLGGVYVVADATGQAGGASAMTAFARANELVPLGSSMATHYAARSFAAGRCAVRQGVRTRDALFVEVGDRAAVTARRAAQGDVDPEVYLRVRLAGPVEPGSELVTPELDEALTRFAGPYVVDVAGDELTLLGSRPLEPRRSGRVAEAFALADALAERAGSRRVVGAGPDLTKPPLEPEPARRRSPWAIAAWTVGLLVVLPLGFAVVMSSLDDGLRGNRPAARAVVGLLVVLLIALAGWLVRLALTPRRRQ